MRKNALITCCFVCALGAFGAFFRWLQNQLAFDTETGMINPSLWNIMVPLVIAAAAVIFYFIIRKFLVGLTAPTEMYATFRGTTFFHPIAAWIIGGIVAIGGIATLFGAGDDVQPGALTFIGIMMIIAGISFPSICTAAKRHLAPGLVSVFSAIPIIVFTLWLIACYVRNASIPNVWKYGVEIITVCVIIVAFFYNAGVAFGKPEPVKALYFSMLGAFLCLLSLADSRIFGLQMIVFGTALMLLMYCWMIVSNMRKQEVSAEPIEEKAAEPEEKAEPVKENDTEPVIPAGEKVVTDEPTIQAPDRGADAVDSIINEVKKRK